MLYEDQVDFCIFILSVLSIPVSMWLTYHLYLCYIEKRNKELETLF